MEFSEETEPCLRYSPPIFKLFKIILNILNFVGRYELLIYMGYTLFAIKNIMTMI